MNRFTIVLNEIYDFIRRTQEYDKLTAQQKCDMLENFEKIQEELEKYK